MTEMKTPGYNITQGVLVIGPCPRYEAGALCPFAVNRHERCGGRRCVLQTRLEDIVTSHWQFVPYEPEEAGQLGYP